MNKMADEETKAKRPCLEMHFDDTVDKSDIYWLQIFKYLEVEDLCCLATVNKQFRRLSKKTFGERYANGCFYYPGTFYWRFRESCESSMRRVLCNFGHLIKSMVLSDRVCLFDVELDAVSKYCAGTLENLDLRINSPIDCDCDLVKPLFRSLKELKIYWNYFDPFIGECTNLKTLTIYDLDGWGLTRAKTIPTLDELTILTFKNTEGATNFLQLNKQIKKLSINESYFYPSIEELDLEHFKMDNVPGDFEYAKILKFKKLKSLSLSGIEIRLDNFLIKIGEELPLLEKLELVFRLNKFPFSIGSLNSFIQRARKLNALKLRHHTNQPIYSEEYYDEILKVCSGLRSLVLYVLPLL